MSNNVSSFVAKIRAEIDDQKAQQQIKAITSQKHTVNVDVKIGNINSITAAAQKAGKAAGDAYAGAMKSAIERGKFDFDTGKFSANNAVFKQMLSQYDKTQSDLLTKARDFSAQYQSIFNDLQNHFNGTRLLNDKELVSAFARINKAGISFKNTMREVATESTKNISALEAKTQSNRILDYMNKNTKAAKKYGDELKLLAQRAASANTVGQMRQITAEFRALDSAITAEGLRGRSFFDNLARSAKSIGQFVGLYRIFRQAIRLVSNMVQEVVKVDSALVELRRVSNATTREIEKSFDAATVSAKKYGQAISDIIKSQSDWARLGYGIKDAQKLADVTTLLQTVGDNMTQKNSSSGLISILKGYQMDVSQAESIVDKLVQVAHTQPIDTYGLVEALQRSVSSMAASGNTLDETIGLITAANAVVQDPATVGTSFKTKFFRNCLYVQKCA